MRRCLGDWKYGKQGFEVIGINLEEDKKELQEFLKNNGLPWPQYFDGKSSAWENRLTRMFGVRVNGIPNMFLIDPRGHLRFDNVLVEIGFEEQIATLLAEP